jgi:hypothetical protein
VYEAYAERTLRVARYLQDASPQQFGDPYAALRHALFLSDALLADAALDEPNVPFAGADNPGPLDPLTRLSVFEFAAGQALRSGWSPTPDLVNGLTHEERAALLRGAVRSQAALDIDVLLAQLGISDTTDALIRDALAVWADNGPSADLAARLRRKFEDATQRGKTRTLTTLLDVAAAHRIPTLEAPEVAHLLQAWDGRERLFIALLRYVGALRIEGVLETLHNTLDQNTALSLARRFALIDALAEIGNPASQPVLERLAGRLGGVSSRPRPGYVPVYRDHAGGRSLAGSHAPPRWAGHRAVHVPGTHRAGGKWEQRRAGGLPGHAGRRAGRGTRHRAGLHAGAAKRQAGQG